MRDFDEAVRVAERLLKIARDALYLTEHPELITEDETDALAYRINEEDANIYALHGGR